MNSTYWSINLEMRNEIEFPKWTRLAWMRSAPGHSVRFISHLCISFPIPFEAWDDIYLCCLQNVAMWHTSVQIQLNNKHLTISVIAINLLTARLSLNKDVLLVHLRSKWTRGLRHELSSTAPTLRSWVRVPLVAWMFLCIYYTCMFLLSCM
jgi:hypothetical protein